MRTNNQAIIIALALLAAAAITAQAQYSITTLDFPGNPYTAAYGISGSNIVGNTSDASLNQSGFIYDGSTYAPVSYPSLTSPTEGLKGR